MDVHAFRRVVVFASLLSPSLARTQELAKVTIKASASTPSREGRLQILPGGDLIGASVSIIELISLAYNVPENPSPRLSAVPEWTVRQRFDITARPPVSLRLGSKDLEIQRQTLETLLRKLLADRFDLVLRASTGRMPVYALVAKGDAKLNRATISSRSCILDTSPEGCHSFVLGFGHPLNARAVDMSDLARYLENWTDLPVVNRTGLRGLFAMHSQGWKPMILPPPPPGTPATGDEFANLLPLSEILSNFGLQLRRQEESLPLYTLERMHQPHSE